MACTSQLDCPAGLVCDYTSGTNPTTVCKAGIGTMCTGDTDCLTGVGCVKVAGTDYRTCSGSLKLLTAPPAPTCQPSPPAPTPVAAPITAPVPSMCKICAGPCPSPSIVAPITTASPATTTPPFLCPVMTTQAAPVTAPAADPPPDILYIGGPGSTPKRVKRRPRSGDVTPLDESDRPRRKK
jgi:hypothetical protein